VAQQTTLWEKGSDIFGRAMATVVFIVLPGFAGAWLDKQLGTGFLTPVGFVLGVLCGVVGLIYTLQRLQPPGAKAGGSQSKVGADLIDSAGSSVPAGRETQRPVSPEDPEGPRAGGGA
jgi:hypothetical protein